MRRIQDRGRFRPQYRQLCPQRLTTYPRRLQSLNQPTPPRHRLNASDPTSDCIADVVIGSKSTGTFCDLNTPGWSIDANGVCVQTPAADTRTVSQKMVAAAGMSDGLSTDEWCYYYSQVTGNDCPVDPGSITYDSGDRSTPISIGEWLSIMNQTGAGLSGLGDDSTPNWGVLVAAGLAYFLLMGGAR